MSNDPQDDFAAIAKPLPTGKGNKSPVAEGDEFAAISYPVELIQNDKNEGLYTMHGPNGTLNIPYSKVEDAFKTGLRFDTPATFRKFQKDKAAEGPSALQRFAASEYGTIGNAVKGIGQFLDPRPSEEEKQRGQTGVYDTLMRYPNRFVQPHVDTALKTEEDIKAGRYSEAVGHGLATVIPVIGPFAAQVGETIGQQVGEGNIAGAAGTTVGSAMVAEAPKVARGVGGIVKNVTGDVIPNKFGSQSVRNLVEKTQETNKAEDARVAEENVKNTEKHLGETLDALQKTRETEDLYSHTEKARQEKLDVKNEADRKKFNEKELERIKKEGEDRLAVLQKNKNAIEDYKVELEKTKAENARNYRREVQRQNLESKLNSASKQLENKFNSALNKARGDYNSTWNKWREKIKNEKADMTTTVNTINAQEASMNPQQVAQFRDILRESAPEEGAKTGIELREDFSQQAFKSPYEKLNPDQKAVIDQDVADRGLDLTSLKLKDVQATRLHGWKSQLERAVRSTQDGTIRYAIGQVLDQLRKEEENVSAKVGPDAVKQLVKARAITGPYFDAFIKSPVETAKAAAQSLRENTPEYIAERNEQARLDRIAAYDPSIKSVANNVANLKEGLAQLKKEGGSKIGKYTDLPTRPILKSPPAITPTGEFTPRPFESKPAPAREAVSDRPPEINPKYKKIGDEDIIDARRKALNATANWLRHRANWIVSGLIISKAPYDLLHGQITNVADDVLMSGVANLITGKIGDWIENPEVENWLTKPTSADIKEIMKLPPEQRGQLGATWKPILQQAKAKGVKVSPTLVMALSGSSQKKEGPKELLQQAQDLQSQFQQQGLAPQ